MLHHVPLINFQNGSGWLGKQGGSGLGLLHRRSAPAGLSHIISAAVLGHPVSPLLYHALLGDFLQETGWQGCCGPPVDHALPGIGDGQRLLGPGNGNIAQPPFFLHFFRIADGPHSREQAIFKTYQEHVWEFQSLR